MGSIRLCGLVTLCFLAEAERPAGPGWEASALPAALAQEETSHSCGQFGAERVPSTLSEMFNIFKAALCRCPEGLVTNSACEVPGQTEFRDKKPHTQSSVRELFGLERCMCAHPCFSFRNGQPKEGTGRAATEGAVCECTSRLTSGRASAPVPTLALGACGAGWGATEFPLVGASKNCSCEEPATFQRIRPQSPIQVSALKFCAAAGEKYRAHMGTEAFRFTERFNSTQRERAPHALEALRLTPELCQAVVAGSFSNSEKKKAPWLEDAAELSEHHGSKGFGRLDPLVGSTLQHHLRQVCHDECTLLVDEVGKTSWAVYYDFAKGLSSEQSCADRVVRRVEAEMLGCCGRTCGWNGRSCMSWPFLTQDHQAAWLAECCAEYNVMKHSSREMMCNSVLTEKDAELVSEHDLSEDGKDVAATYLGQDPRLLWTKNGAASDLGSKYSFLDPTPEAGHAVAEELLRQEPNIRQKGLMNDWFVKESTEPENFSPKPTSFLTVAAAADCETGPLDMTRCSADFKRWQHEACIEGAGWQARKVKRDRARKPGCKRSAAIHVATPHECLQADLGNFSKMVRGEKKFAVEEEARYFQYNKGQNRSPITCYVASENFQCNFEDIESAAWNLDKIVFLKPLLP